MANHKSAEKRARQTIKKTAPNNQRKTTVKTAVKAVREALAAKAVREAIASNDKTAALKLLPKAQSLLNKLAKVGIIKKQNAGRKTSRLVDQVNKLK